MESKTEPQPASFCSTYGQPSTEAGGDAFGGLLVSQVLPVLPGGSCKLRTNYVLGDAASGLVASGRTAGAVADEEGEVISLITENDILRAFFEGMSPDTLIGDWLEGGMARAPSGRLLGKLTVSASEPLSEVARRMVANALAGDCAFHHVLVRDDDGHLHGVLSSLDMVRALCRPEMWGHRMLHRPEGESGSLPAGAAAGMSVQDVMKPRDAVFTCPRSSSMRDVLKVLLLAQQNSVLIADQDGISGVVTPRDAVKAFEQGIENNICIEEWLQSTAADTAPRVIACTASLAEAAAVMASRDLHHLVAVLPDSPVAVGVLSSLDLVLCTRAQAPLLRPFPPPSAGPSVGELVGKAWHASAICPAGTTLRQAAELLARTGRSAAAMALEEFPGRHLVTENDVVRALVAGWAPDGLAEAWLAEQDAQRPTGGSHVLVPPGVRLTDAASTMLEAVEPGREPCHHLVVQGSEGNWLGVFSALDVARALCDLQSELETAKTTADSTTVREVMKTRSVVPTCRANDTLKVALGLLCRAGQNAALVVDEAGKHCGVITPRCAVKAAAAGVDLDMQVEDWLQHEANEEGPREVEPGARLVDAAATMSTHCLHHLLVVEEPACAPVGVLSALDLARGIASVSCQRPFASLFWLRLCKGVAACSLRA